MATKSVGQRIVEGIALVLVAIVAVPVVIIVGSRFWPEQAEQSKTPAQPLPAAQQAAAAPEPQRERVASVTNLPSTYPEISELVIVTDSPADRRDNLPAVEPAALKRVSIRHLNAFNSGEVRLSPKDDRLAVVTEQTPAGTVRLAVWDVASGKLLRFLSSEVGKTPKPFQGKENADFGAKVDLEEVQQMAYSPSGQRFAARKGMALVSDGLSAFAWDVASGRLLSRFDEASKPMDVFDFPHEDYLVLGVSYGQRNTPVTLREGPPTAAMRNSDRALLRVVATSGEAELLTPIGVGPPDFGRSAVRDGLIAFHGVQELHTVDVGTRQHRQGELLTGTNRFLYQKLWFSPDGKSVYGCTSNGKLEMWDVAMLQPVQSWPLKASNSIAPVLPAPAAGLVALHEGQTRNVDVFEVATGKLATVLHLPFRGGRLKAISSDARRLIVGTDQLSLLVVDFPDGLPKGAIDLADLLKAKLPATRS